MEFCVHEPVKFWLPKHIYTPPPPYSNYNDFYCKHIIQNEILIIQYYNVTYNWVASEDGSCECPWGNRVGCTLSRHRSQ